MGLTEARKGIARLRLNGEKEEPEIGLHFSPILLAVAFAGVYPVLLCLEVPEPS